MGKGMEKRIKAVEAAHHNFYNGLTCSESVFDALWHTGVLEEHDAPYSACSMCAGFSGGMGGTGLVCGALSASIMAVGAKHGRKNSKLDPKDGPYEMEFKRYNNMMAEFAAAMGSPLCREITKDFSGEEFFSPQRKKRCDEAVENAVNVACKYMDMSTEEVADLPVYEDVQQK